MSTEPTSSPESQPDETRAPGLRLSRRGIAALIAAALLLVFMLQNTQDVRVHLFFWYATLPLWFVILGSALVGAFIWLGFSVVRRHRHRVARRRAGSQ